MLALKDQMVPPLNRKRVTSMYEDIPVYVVFAYNDRGFPTTSVKVVVKVVKTTLNKVQQVYDDNLHLSNAWHPNSCYGEIYLAPPHEIIPSLLSEK